MPGLETKTCFQGTADAVRWFDWFFDILFFIRYMRYAMLFSSGRKKIRLVVGYTLLTFVNNMEHWRQCGGWLSSMLAESHLSGDYLYCMDYMVQNHRQRGAYIGICCLPIDGRWFQFSYQVLDKLKCFLWLKNLILKNHLLIEFWRINWSLICSILKMEALNMFCGGRRGKCACPNLAWGW